MLLHIYEVIDPITWIPSNSSADWYYFQTLYIARYEVKGWNSTIPNSSLKFAIRKMSLKIELLTLRVLCCAGVICYSPVRVKNDSDTELGGLKNTSTEAFSRKNPGKRNKALCNIHVERSIACNLARVVPADSQARTFHSRWAGSID